MDNYEEKYKSALKWMQSLYGGLHGATKEEAEKYFPELKESEGERIRKKLISFVENWKNFRPNSPFDDYAVYTSDRDECDRILAWLEKQGTKEVDPRYENLEELLVADNIYQMSMNDAMVEEAKSKAINALSELAISKILGLEKQGEQPTDKVEPKFKVGDWIVLPLGIIAHIESLNSTDYQVTTTDGKNCDFKISKQDNYRFWTIADAKDGDILAADAIESHPSPFVAICKKQDGELFETYCFIGHDGKFYGGEIGHVGGYVHPATKEQRDTLEMAMTNAGYRWDKEKLKLEKL